MAKPRMKERQDLGLASGIGSRADPEVLAQLETRERRRAKAKRGARPKGTFDLPQSVLDELRRVAKEEDVAVSDLVALAIIDLLDDYHAGQLDLETLKVRAHSMRVGWRLQLPPEWA